MHRERDGMARAGRWLAVAVAGLAACSGFQDGDRSAPRIVRVMVYDYSPFRTNAPVVVEDPGPAATLADVPSMFGAIRIDFSKPLDGATIQRNGGSPLCQAAANIVVTKDGEDITSKAYVCYDPSGTNPNLTAVLEASPTCAGPDPNVPALGAPQGLVPGATYVLRATDVADRDGHRLSFTVTVRAAVFVASGATVGGAPLDGATDVAPGALDEATGLFTTPTAALAANSAQNMLGVLYGTPLDVHFTGGPMCPTSFGSLCAGPFSLRLGADDIETGPAAVGDDADGLVQHVVPWLPLESGRTYGLTVEPGWFDGLGNASAAGFTSTFTTAAGAPRVVWHWPLAGATGAYATVDQGILRQWTGQPMLGVAASAPLDPTGQLTLTRGGAAVAGVTQTTGESRSRSLTFATTDKLPLENDTEYTVSWSGLAAGGAALQNPAGSFTFRTLPFGQDPSFPGFASFVVKYTTASTSARASYLRLAQGNVFPSLAGQPIAYFTTATGKVAYDAATVVGTYTAPGRPEAFTFHALGGGGSVILFEGAPSANVVVPGIGGYARVGVGATTEPWDAADPALGYPGSLLGFVPAAVLKADQLYTLVANVVPLGGSQTVQLTLPFTTAPFRVALALDGSQVYDLSTGPVEATFDAANPLVLRTTSRVDPAVFGSAPTTDGPIQVRRADGTKVAIHLVSDPDATRGAGQWIDVVPDDAIAASTEHTVVVTSALRSSRGEAIVPITYTFTTAPARDGAGAPVCAP